MAAAMAGVVIYSKKLNTTAEKAKVIPLRPTAASCAEPSLPTKATHNIHFQASVDSSSSKARHSFEY